MSRSRLSLLKGFQRAGGDVKKNGVDPYAYLTLGQAAGGKKGRGKAKVSILGKR
jgi:ribosomal RNA-processing protein 12